MKNTRANPAQNPKRGEVWQPKDAAHHDVIIADTAPEIVHLQYVESPEFTFMMDKATFLRYYTFRRHHRHIPPPNTIYNEPFFA